MSRGGDHSEHVYTQCSVKGRCQVSTHKSADPHPSPLSEYIQVHDEEGDLRKKHSRRRKDRD